MYSNILLTFFSIFISTITSSPLIQPYSLGISLLNVSSPTIPNLHTPQLPTLPNDSSIIRFIKRWKFETAEGATRTGSYYTPFINLEPSANYIIAYSFESETVISWLSIKSREKEILWQEYVRTDERPRDGSTAFKMMFPNPITIGFSEYTGKKLSGFLELYQVGP